MKLKLFALLLGVCIFASSRALAADAAWTKLTTSAPGVNTWTASVTSAATQTEILEIDPKTSAATVFVNVGSGETIQLQGSNTPSATSSDMQILIGADAIIADFDDTLATGVTSLRATGAVTNTTVITISQVAD